MIQVKRLGHATFNTPDLERIVDYWTRIIGLTLVHKEKNRAVLATKYGDRVDRERIVYAGYSQAASMGILYLQQGGATEAKLLELAQLSQAAQVFEIQCEAPDAGVDALHTAQVESPQFRQQL